MAEKRNRNPSDAECFILDVFLNRIYRDRDGANRYCQWNFKGISDNPEFRLPYYWVNTPQELFENYCKFYPEEKGFQRYKNESSFYKVLEDLVEKGIIKKTQTPKKIQTESRYYPVETTDGYIRLVKYVVKDYASGFYPNKKFGLDPLYSKYSEIVLNRQFILDCLRRKADSFKILLNGRPTKIPILGRYVKNYEIGPRMNGYLEMLEAVKKLLEDENVTDYKPIMNLLLDCDDPVPEDNGWVPGYHKLTPDKRKSNLQMLDTLLLGLRTELEFINGYKNLIMDLNDGLVSLKQFSDDLTEQYAEHLSKIAPEHSTFLDDSTEIYGLSWYRQEATWGDPELTENEKRALDNICDGFAGKYAEWLNDRIVLPLLCLVQMSPSALCFLATESFIEPPERCFTYSCENSFWIGPLAVDSKVDSEIFDFKKDLKSYNVLVGCLTKFALADYLNHKICIRDASLHNKISLTQLISFGNAGLEFRAENEQYTVPALFTFGIHKGCVTYIQYNDCPNYKPMQDILSPVADCPRAPLMDWTPALGVTVKKYPHSLTRLYELTNLIIEKIQMQDFYLSNLIHQSILRGIV